MGGYGGSSGSVKGKCYYDTGGHKVTDKNAITVAERYIKEGKYVAFLQEKPDQKRADLSVDGVHTEVKGLTTTNSTKIADRIKKAFEQVDADNYRYDSSTHREGKVILLSQHKNLSDSEILHTMTTGFNKAYKAGYVSGKVEVWIGNKIYKLN